MLEISTRKKTCTIKGTTFKYDENYYIDSETGEEVFNKDLMERNEETKVDTYKSITGLLTSLEIKTIRNKYQMNQKEFAKVLGIGDVTIHRYEKGSIQTDSVDSMIRLCTNPNNMLCLINRNQDKLKGYEYDKFKNIILDVIKESEHKIACFDKEILNFLKFTQSDKVTVASKLINVYNQKAADLFSQHNISYINRDMESIKLNILLYYVQALTLHIFDDVAFPDKFYKKEYGPSIINLLETSDELVNIDNSNLCEGIKAIINIVVDTYGNFELRKLIEMVLDEKPIKDIDLGEYVKVSSIKEYFNNLYS